MKAKFGDDSRIDPRTRHVERKEKKEVEKKKKTHHWHLHPNIDYHL